MADSVHGGTSTPQNWDRRGLPAWTYYNAELLELEKQQLFRRHWQLVCHTSDVPNPGDWRTLDVAGDRALVLRGADGVLRAFHNVCPHRGSRVAVGESGHCKSVLVCPFHGWSFHLDGRLRAPARPSSLPALDPEIWGLTAIELEIWHGFVFVRFTSSEQPSVAELLARFETEVAPYEIERMLPTGAPNWTEVTAANWKSVRDVDNEGYHVAKAHPGLHDLYGQNYHDEPYVDGVSRSVGQFNDGPGTKWCVRHYKSILPEADWLPESHRQAWVYLGLFPNTVIGLYPDSVIFYQEFPLAVDRTYQRGAVYRRPDESRALRAARYLSGRIDWLTAAEDRELTEWSWEASQSSGYRGVLLSDLEYGVRTYHDHLRRIIPVTDLEQEPAPGTVATTNQAHVAVV